MTKATNRNRNPKEVVRGRDAPPPQTSTFADTVSGLALDVPVTKVRLQAASGDSEARVELSDESGLELKRLQDDAVVGRGALSWANGGLGHEDTALTLESVDQRLEAGDEAPFSSHATLGFLVQRDVSETALELLGGNFFEGSSTYNINALAVEDPASGSPTWTQHTGVFTVTSGTDGLAHATNDASNRNFATWDTGVANFRIETVLSTHGTGGVAFRYTDANNCWFYNNATGTLVKRVAGVQTTVATWDGTGGAHRSNSNWDRTFIRVICYGNGIAVYRDGVPVVATTDAANNTATRVGLYAAGPSLSNIVWERQQVFTALSADPTSFDVAQSTLGADMGNENGDLETSALLVGSTVYEPGSITLYAPKITLASGLEDHVAEITIEVEGLNVVGEEGQPAFQNSWVNFGGGLGSLAFFKDPFGVVHISGTVKSGTVGGGANVFTLPVGYRPSTVRNFAIVSNNAFGKVIVRDTGGVEVDVGSSTSASLDGITFKATAA